MSRLRERAEEHQVERHSSVWGWALAGLLVIVCLAPVVANDSVLDGYGRRILLLAGINITLAVSLNLINGVTGQFSIGHAGFMAIGAYVAAAMTVFGGTALEQAAGSGGIDPHAPALNLWLQATGDQPPTLPQQVRAQAWFALSLVAAGLVAALAGLVVGQPSLRLRGDYLAIATLGFSEIVRVVLLNLQQMGGASGFTGTEPFGSLPPYSNFANIFIVALLCVLAVTTLKRSAQGRSLLAVREDEVAAEALGIDTTRSKVFAFVFSSFFAGVAGGLFAHFNGIIIPSQTMFGFLRSFEVIVMVVLGGSGSTTGAVLAAVVMTGLPEWLRELAEYRMVLYAEILLVLMLVRRQGLLGSREICSRDWFRAWYFLHRHGAKGVLRGIVGWFAGAFRGLVGRLRRPTGGVDPLAVFCVLLPVADLLAAWYVRRLGSGPVSFSAEIASSLSALVPQVMGANPGFAEVAARLQLPFKANLGLTVALLPLILPWTALAFSLAAGEARAARWLTVAGALFVWHGGGLMASGVGLPRTGLETLLGAVLLLGGGWRWLRRRRDGRA